MGVYSDIFNTAITANDIARLESLVAGGGFDINGFLDNGDTPLICAIDEGGTETVLKLIELGADVTLKDKSGESSPLAMMIGSAGFGRDDRSAIIKKIFEKGAGRLDLEEDVHYGMTGLCYATIHGWFDIADLYIAHGADVNAISDKEAPLAALVSRYYDDKNGQLVLVDRLIEAGADTGSASGEYKSYLAAAIYEKNYGILPALLEAASDKALFCETDHYGTSIANRIRIIGIDACDKILQARCDDFENRYGFHPLKCKKTNTATLTVSQIIESGGMTRGDMTLKTVYDFQSCRIHTIVVSGGNPALNVCDFADKAERQDIENASKILTLFGGAPGELWKKYRPKMAAPRPVRHMNGGR